MRALTRPDVFRSVVLMSAPFGGPPRRACRSARRSTTSWRRSAAKHYQWYYSTREADADMRDCPQGVHAFLRAYYHYKSADWPGNKPYPLEGLDRRRAGEAADLLHHGARQGHGRDGGAGHAGAARRAWLTDEELAVYAEAFERNGFQGGLQWYRCGTSADSAPSCTRFAGRTIDVPSMFIAGASDWGVYQKPGEFERMQRGLHATCAAAISSRAPATGCSRSSRRAVNRLLLDFLRQ